MLMLVCTPTVLDYISGLEVKFGTDNSYALS